MRVRFTQLGNLQVSDGEGSTVAYTHEAGAEVELPSAIAKLFIEQGVATEIIEAKPERATAPAKPATSRSTKGAKK